MLSSMLRSERAVHWSRDQDGTIVRCLLNVDLNNGDVAAVTFPVYPDTEVEARALEHRAWNQPLAAAARAREHANSRSLRWDDVTVLIADHR